jgi:hypothetical protein
MTGILYSRKESPLGKTWEEWTAEWWRWILEIPSPRNPGYDVDGTIFSETKQTHSDPIFLPGTYDGSTNRTIKIKEGNSVLLPIINVTTSFAEAPHLQSKDELMTFVEKNTNDLLYKEALIDGVTLEDVDQYRVRSDFFTFTFPKNNIYGAKSGQTTGISDGYWLFLRPLSTGKHSIQTFGSCLAGKIRIEVKYTIHVI